MAAPSAGSATRSRVEQAAVVRAAFAPPQPAQLTHTTDQLPRTVNRSPRRPRARDLGRTPLQRPAPNRRCGAAGQVVSACSPIGYPDDRRPQSDPDPDRSGVDSSETSLFGHWDIWVPAVSVAAIWLATLASALLSPDLVTGSRQEHFPLVGLWIG